MSTPTDSALTGLQKVNVEPPSESAPTLRMVQPSGRGVLPKRAARR